MRAECGCGFCRLCVTEYVASAATVDGGTTMTTTTSCSCPKCGKPLTVDLSAATSPLEVAEPAMAEGKKEGARTPHGPWRNRAGTAVVVAGRVKLQGLDRKSILHRIQLENFQSSTKLEVRECVSGVNDGRRSSSFLVRHDGRGQD